MKLSTRLKVAFGRIMSSRNSNTAELSKPTSNEAKRILNAFRGSFTLGTERIHVPAVVANSASSQLQCLAKEVDSSLELIASIEDQFDSVLLLGETGEVYLCFLEENSEWSIERYAETFEEALDRLNV